MDVEELPMHKDTYFFGYGIDIENQDEMARQVIELKEENQELKNKIKELIKYGFGTDMSLGEFKEFYKLATGKDYNPKKCPEVE